MKKKILWCSVGSSQFLDPSCTLKGSLQKQQLQTSQYGSALQKKVDTLLVHVYSNYIYLNQVKVVQC